MEETVDVVVYPEASFDRLNGDQLRESLVYFCPDVVVVEEPYQETRLTNPGTDFEVVHLRNWSTVLLTDGPGPQLAAISGSTDFDTLREHEQIGHIDTGVETYILSSELSVDINLTSLETRLEGRELYEPALEEADLDGSYTHLTSEANPDYRSEWGGLSVQGIFPGRSGTDVQQSTDIAMLSLYPDGTVAADTYDPGMFGLQALTQVGPKKAATIREAGLTTKSEVANSSITELQQLDRIGKKTAQKILYSAKALATDRVYRTSTDSLPGNDPVFIDIETDGLTPQMIWLIGVYDSQTNQYMSFLATDPDEKGEAVTAFASWFAANATNRPIVAYHGEGFDFPHLHDHINRHAPEHSAAWQDAWTFDPYWWAIKQNNAVLPGPTNQLEDVAEALGWETDDTGLSGAVVGQRFQRYMQNPCDATELDWERHETYCEDDVRSLAYVFDALRDADPIEGVGASDSPNESPETTTAQGTFDDF
jgi:uncharacterized protein YprB with RNaseH-like and TPR domain